MTRGADTSEREHLVGRTTSAQRDMVRSFLESRAYTPLIMYIQDGLLGLLGDFGGESNEARRLIKIAVSLGKYSPWIVRRLSTTSDNYQTKDTCFLCRTRKPLTHIIELRDAPEDTQRIYGYAGDVCARRLALIIDVHTLYYRLVRNACAIQLDDASSSSSSSPPPAKRRRNERVCTMAAPKERVEALCEQINALQLKVDEFVLSLNTRFVSRSSDNYNM